jgi:hypothetical protein
MSFPAAARIELDGGAPVRKQDNIFHANAES